MEINNKVVIITGGIRGIGLATVQHMLRKGAKYVAILDVHKPDSEVVINNLQQLEKEFGRGKFGYSVCDVTADDQFTANYEKILKQYSYVDILVNNAGVSAEKNIDRIVDVNVKAVIKNTLTAIEHMGLHKGGKGGAVVSIGSFLGLVSPPPSPVYNATKHAVVSFVKSMKAHNEKLGVRILCVCPGMTQTDMVTPTNLLSGMLDFIDQSHMTKHFNIHLQKPDNVAEAVVGIVERGKPGDVWLAKDDQPPYNVKDVESLEELRIPF